MLDRPQIIQTTAKCLAIVPLTIPKSELQIVIGPGLAELLATVAAQGVKTIGPWFTHHLRFVPDIWDFEIGVAVETPIVAAGRVRPSNQPSVKAIRTVYHGPYERLGQAWESFSAEIEAEGHETTSELWEHYLVGRDTVAEAADFRTELIKRLAG